MSYERALHRAGDFTVAIRSGIGWRVLSDYGREQDRFVFTRGARDRELKRQAAEVMRRIKVDNEDRSIKGRELSPRVNVALCPKHGLHGARHRCFVCGGEVEQIPMVAVGAYDGRTWPR